MSNREEDAKKLCETLHLSETLEYDIVLSYLGCAETRGYERGKEEELLACKRIAHDEAIDGGSGKAEQVFFKIQNRELRTKQ